LEVPNPKSSKYLSCIGNLDSRVNIDILKREDNKYYVNLAMMAAKAVYENEAFLKYTIKYDWKVQN